MTTTTAQPAHPFFRKLDALIRYLSEDFLGGPRVLKFAWVINRLLENPLRAQVFRLVRNRGALLKAGVRPSKKGNDECAPA